MNSSSRQGMTLLEALVALVILGTVAVGMLEVLAGSARVASSAEQWSRAVAYAEQRMEALKIDSATPALSARESLEGGFTRWVDERPWSEPGFVMVTVGVELPGGGHHSLVRLRAAR